MGSEISFTVNDKYLENLYKELNYLDTISVLITIAIFVFALIFLLFFGIYFNKHG